jgi:hypothetical protein
MQDEDADLCEQLLLPSPSVVLVPRPPDLTLNKPADQLYSYYGPTREAMESVQRSFANRMICLNAWPTGEQEAEWIEADWARYMRRLANPIELTDGIRSYVCSIITTRLSN